MRQKSLASYQTQLSDVAKGITRVPLPLARLTEEDIIKLDEVIEHGIMTHVQVRKESSDADRLSDLERLEELGKNLEKQLDLRNSSNSDSGSGNEYPAVDVLNDTAFFHEVLDHRREAWQSTIITSDDVTNNDPIKDKDQMQSERIYQRSTVGERCILE